MNILEAARLYYGRGYALTALRDREKIPFRKGWPTHRYTEQQLAEEFTDGINVGVIVGSASGGLTDIDLDSDEALAVASEFLPPTDMIHGRPGNPESHWWYISDVPKTIQFKDPIDKEMILEVRGGDNTHQTLLPPSLHPDGENYEWDSDGEPAQVSASELLRKASEAAAAALLAKYFPDYGRHEWCLALGGMLLRGGWETDRAYEFVHTVADAGGSDNPAARADTVRYTALKIANDEPATGYTRLHSLLGLNGSAILEKVIEWLDLRSEEHEESFTLTELGVAERVAARHGSKLMYVPEMKSWFTWGGQRWVRDIDGEVRRVCIDEIKAMHAEAENAIGAIEHKLLEVLDMPKSVKRREMLECFEIDEVLKAEHARSVTRFALAMQTKQKIVAVVDLLTTVKGIPRRQSELDANDWLFNCANGTIDLKTGQLKPHDPTDMITKMSPVAYDASATCPTFDRFLAEIMPDAEMRGYLQAGHGYSLSGSTREQCYFLNIGTGNNGKGVLDRLRRKAWGDYATSAAPSTFLSKTNDGIRNDIADLTGSRLVSVSEIEKGRRLAESLVKHVTGQDAIKSRFLHCEHFESMPTYKLWMSSNYRPHVDGTDGGIWRRTKVIPFDVVIPEERQDKTLTEKLEAELPGILSWAVRGCLKWQREGLVEPQRIRDEVQTYRETMDPLGEWFDENCIPDPDAWTATADLYRDYSSYSIGRGLVLQQREFTDHLPHRGLSAKMSKVQVAGKRSNARGWQGVRLRRGVMTDVSRSASSNT